MEATKEVVVSEGFAGVTIAAVAKRAGVTRQTVYSIFGTREDLVSQAMVDHLGGVVACFHTRLAETATPAEYVVELIVECRRIFRTDPLLGALLRAGTGNPVFDAGALERAHVVGLELLAPLRTRFPGTAPRLDDIVELCVHLGWSVVCFGDHESRSDDDLRAFLHRWIGPAFANR
nr:TetR/AcrR family transcriptional regulator [Rhodococcus sp. HNM0569]